MISLDSSWRSRGAIHGEHGGARGNLRKARVAVGSGERAGRLRVKDGEGEIWDTLTCRSIRKRENRKDNRERLERINPDEPSHLEADWRDNLAGSVGGVGSNVSSRPAQEGRKRAENGRDQPEDVPPDQSQRSDKVGLGAILRDGRVILVVLAR